MPSDFTCYNERRPVISLVIVNEDHLRSSEFTDLVKGDY
jgi:hypothetical protein